MYSQGNVSISAISIYETGRVAHWCSVELFKLTFCQSNEIKSNYHILQILSNQIISNFNWQNLTNQIKYSYNSNGDKSNQIF